MKTSQDIKEIAVALNKMQWQIKNPVKNSSNPFFKSKYADLSEVWEAIREPLTSNGLSIIQAPESINGEVKLVTLLLHTSGQYIETELTLKPVKADPQGMGSAITYGRRYALQSIIGLAPEDDDGNSASGHNNKPAQEDNQSQSSSGEGKISDKQRGRLWYLSKKNQELLTSVIKEFGYENTKDIHHKDYDQICNIIESKAGVQE